MNPLLCFLRRSSLVILLLAAGARTSAADARALADLKTELLDAYRSGQTDSDLNVKQLREKIAALEYVAHAEAQAPAGVPVRLVNIDFQGGTMASFLEAANKAGAPFNVLAEKNDLALELPPFSLRNADPTALANAMGELLRQRGFALQSNVRTWPGQAPVYALRKLGPYEIPVDQRMVPQFQSFQLAPYLEAQSVDDIVGAIRAAWELDSTRNSDSLRIKFHPPTGVLLISGPQQAIIMVQGILKELRRLPEQPWKIPSKAGAPAPAAEKK